MRVAHTALNQFVPGRWTLPENPVTGRLGFLSEFVDAEYTVPQNPVQTAGVADFFDWSDPYDDSVEGQSGLGDLRDFVAGAFAVPQNPVLTNLAGFRLGNFVPTGTMYPVQPNSVLQAYGLGRVGDSDDCGCGCGGHGTCGEGTGLGAISDTIDQATGWLSGQFGKIMAGDMTTIAIWGGGALVLGYLLFGHRWGGYRGARKELAAEYRAKAAKLRAEYPTSYGRARRAAAAF